ncbi:hypothetical protein CCP3SC1_260020 [Gammaproteobacteria bacterium]
MNWKIWKILRKRSTRTSSKLPRFFFKRLTIKEWFIIENILLIIALIILGFFAIIEHYSFQKEESNLTTHNKLTAASIVINLFKLLF